MAARNYPLDSDNSVLRIVAFFKRRDDAYRAVSELKDHGFGSNEIGLALGRDMESTSTTGQPATGMDPSSRQVQDRGFWQEIKDFFKAESHDEADNDVNDFRSTASGMNWDEGRSNYYEQGLNSGGALVSVSGTRAAEARIIIERLGGDLRESGFERSATPIRRATGDSQSSIPGREGSNVADSRIQLRGELLRTYKERVQRGEVRLRKEVVTENKTIDVPVTHEELVIERTSPTGDVRATGDIGTEQEIRVPLSEERVRVDKQQVVNEEVRVGKRQVQKNQPVTDSVRHEELRVEKEGDVDNVTDSSVIDQKKGRRRDPAA